MTIEEAIKKLEKIMGRGTYCCEIQNEAWETFKKNIKADRQRLEDEINKLKDCLGNKKCMHEDKFKEILAEAKTEIEDLKKWGTIFKGQADSAKGEIKRLEECDICNSKTSVHLCRECYNKKPTLTAENTNTHSINLLLSMLDEVLTDLERQHKIGIPYWRKLRTHKRVVQTIMDAAGMYPDFIKMRERFMDEFFDKKTINNIRQEELEALANKSASLPAGSLAKPKKEGT